MSPAWLPRFCAGPLLLCMMSPPVHAQATATAHQLFKSHCAACHGAAGEGSRGPSLRVPVLKRANDIDSMVSLLRRGIDGTEMRGTPFTMISDSQIQILAAYVLTFRTEIHNTASGQIERGAELFTTKANCLRCHRVNGKGRALAPDLTDIGRYRDLDWLRRAVLDPEADIFDSFENYRWFILLPENYLHVEIKTKTGERISGYRLNEDSFTIQIRDGQGRPRSFLKSELAQLRKHWGKSPMPSYKGVLTGDEIEDLVAYLASLRGPR